MPNQEQQREDKLREAAKSTFPINKPEDATVPEYALTINAVWLSAYLEGAKSEAAKEYHRTPVDVEKLRTKLILAIGPKLGKVDLPTMTETFDFLLPHLQPSGENEMVAFGTWLIENFTFHGFSEDGISYYERKYQLKNEDLPYMPLTVEQLYTEFLKHKQLPLSTGENKNK